MSNKDQTTKAKIIAAIVVFVAFLSALGTGFQNASAIQGVMTMLSASNAWVLGVVAGGICSTIVNFCLNVELLEDFWERIRGKKPAPHLPGIGKKLRYGVGIAVFVITGFLFGLSAVTIGATGGIAILAIIAGVFVSLVMIPQELETWLQSFDDPVAVAIGKKMHEVKSCEFTPDEKDTTSKLINGNSGFPADLKKITLKAGLQKIKTELMLQHNLTPTSDRLAALTKAIANIEVDKPNFDAILESLIAQPGDINSQDLQNLKKRIDTQQQTLKNLKGKTKEEIATELNTLKEAAEAVQPQISLFEAIKKWWLELTFGRFLGLVISLGNVMALSLMFTIGITPFFVSIGIAAFPALIAGFCIAFTIGAFTEFYFYHYFLADFCDQVKERWAALINSQNYGVGILTVVVNGTVNGVLGYTSVLLLGGLLAAAGIAAPPLLPLAIVAGIFAGVASCLLGTDFWIRNAKRFADFVEKIAGVTVSMAEDNPASKMGYALVEGVVDNVDETLSLEDTLQSQNPLAFSKKEFVDTSADPACLKNPDNVL